MLTKNSFATDMLISYVFGVVRAGTSILVALVSMAMELRSRTRREPPSCPDQERIGNASPLNTFPWDNTMNPRPMVIACIAATVITGACVTIDGGAWLRGAGMFNTLERVSSEQWDELQAAMKPRKK